MYECDQRTFVQTLSIKVVPVGQVETQALSVKLSASIGQVL